MKRRFLLTALLATVLGGPGVFAQDVADPGKEVIGSVKVIVSVTFRAPSRPRAASTL